MQTELKLTVYSPPNPIGMNRKSLLFLCLIAIPFPLCGFSWFGRSQEKPLDKLIKEYNQRGIVRDTRGNLYKIADRYGGKSIPVLRSSDGGKSWTSRGCVETYLTYNVWGSALTIDKDDNLYLSWSGDSVEAHRQEELQYRFKAIFFSSSTDGGKRWKKQLIVNNKETAGMNPVIFVDSKKNIYLCWYGKPLQQMVYLTSSSDGGGSWRKIEDLRSGEDACFSEDSDGTVYLTYAGGEKKNIIFISYTQDGGESWHTVTPGELPVIVKDPYATRFDNTIYLIFHAWIPSILEAMPHAPEPTYQLYYLRSEDGGERWSKLIKVKKR